MRMGLICLLVGFLTIWGCSNDSNGTAGSGGAGGTAGVGGSGGAGVPAAGGLRPRPLSGLKGKVFTTAKRPRLLTEAASESDEIGPRRVPDTQG